MIWLRLESEVLPSVAYEVDRRILHLLFRKADDVYG
jgi:hypothetical protein